MFWVVEGIIPGVISGVISSVFLYIVIFRIKPRLKISDDICRDKQNHSFRVKVVNLTRVNLVDVKYTLDVCYPHGDGIVDIQEIIPAKSRMEFMEAYSSDEENSNYAVRLSYNIDDSIFQKDCYFLFTFYAKHAVSGTATFIRKQFYPKNIKCGHFEMGKSTKIIVEPCHQTFCNCNKRCG